MSSNDSTLDISVVLATSDWATIRPVVESLKRTQPVKRLELILVAPDAGRLASESEGLEGFGSIRFIAHPLPPLNEARAAGVRAATSDIVFIGETHSFSRAGMTEALIAAHGEGWEVVVPKFENANPINFISAGNFIADYGGWAYGEESRPLTSMPVYNASFNRPMLQELAGDLALTLGQGDAVLLTLGQRRIVYEPDALIGHVNLCTFRFWSQERTLAGIVIGSRRLARWSRLRGLAYAAASPLIALTLLARIWPHYLRIRKIRTLPAGTGAVIVVNCFMRAIGEGLGYLGVPATRASHWQDRLEINKLKLTRLSP